MIDGWKDRLRNALKISSPFQNNVYRGFCSVEGGRKGDVYDFMLFFENFNFLLKS
jgi:hypothetical protein